MRYFENAHERSVFRSQARSQLCWYRDKIYATQKKIVTDPRKFSFNDYMGYVRECKLLEDYISALDAEDRADGIIRDADANREAPHANLQREAVLSQVVVEYDRRMEAIRDALAFLKASGFFDQLTGMESGVIQDIVRAAEFRDTHVTDAAKADARGYKVVPEGDPMMPIWDQILPDDPVMELMCIIYNFQYDVMSADEQAAMREEAAKWYQAIRGALV